MSLLSLFPSLDTLLSLPLLSFYLLPATGGYTTSLNILFFYLTWTTLVWSHSAINIEVWGTLAVRVIFYIVPSVLFLCFDFCLSSFAEGIKAHGRIALPFRNGGKKVALVMLVSFCNVAIGALLQLGIELLFTKVLGIRSALKVATRLPMPWGIAKDLTRGFLIRGFTSYYLHRFLLHNPNLIFSSLHQSWHHSIRAPYSFVANYDHPIPWIIGRWIPIYLPAALFRYHLLTFFLMLTLISLEEAFAYSGYSVLPSTILLRGVARRQDLHMLSRGKGNFGPWGFLDWIHGTSLGGPQAIDDVQQELKKHDVSNKAKRAVKNASDLIVGSEDDDSLDEAITSEEQEQNDTRREKPRRRLRLRSKK